MMATRPGSGVAYAQAIRGLLNLEPDLDKQAKYIEFVDIYAHLTDNERKRYEQEYPEASTAMAGFLERAREEGMQRGMEQGMQQGECAVLERQLQRRFGPLTSDVQPVCSVQAYFRPAMELQPWRMNFWTSR